ncbi:hypothetical protein ACH4PW_31785 [Streptomyces sp. NPDC017082]|uniref:hypothetical protein n=1 Tax=Streptomyces sp. NPDC017082 TaxID=3364974 RepID=UPI00379AD533
MPSTPLNKDKPVRRVLRTGALALATAALLAPATPASPAAPQAAPPKAGKYCGDWENFYGPGRHIYGEARICLNNKNPRQPMVQLENRELQGWWYSWRYPTEERTAFSSGSGALFRARDNARMFGYYVASEFQRVHHAVADTTINRDLPDDDNAPGGHPRFQPIAECGEYRITFQYFQDGPWKTGPEYLIKADERTYTLNLPC